ncbi:MAG: hypothetical protein AAF823_12500 [Planctomycetota bacterium]
MFFRLIAPASLCVVASAASAEVLNDFDGTQDFGFFDQGSVTSTITNVDGDADNELEVTVPGSGDNFRLLLQNGVAPNGSVIDALIGAQTLTLDVTAKDSEISQNFDLGIRFKTDSLGGFGQSDALGRLTILDGQDNSLQIVADLDAPLGSGTVRSALIAFQAGNGSFLEIAIDNAGFPGIATQQVFAIDNLATTPIPEPASLALGLVAGGLVLARRRD